MDAHQGEIGVHSGHGSTFFLELPLVRSLICKQEGLVEEVKVDSAHVSYSTIRLE
jgi:hypothetical protein